LNNETITISNFYEGASRFYGIIFLNYTENTLERCEQIHQIDVDRVKMSKQRDTWQEGFYKLRDSLDMNFHGFLQRAIKESLQFITPFLAACNLNRFPCSSKETHVDVNKQTSLNTASGISTKKPNLSYARETHRHKD
jgi:hypothetical protein